LIIAVLKDTEFGEIAQKQPFRRSRSFKVATFDTNAKPECDLLGVSNVHSGMEFDYIILLIKFDGRRQYQARLVED